MVFLFHFRRFLPLNRTFLTLCSTFLVSFCFLKRRAHHSDQKGLLSPWAMLNTSLLCLTTLACSPALGVLCRVALRLMDRLVMTISSNEWSGFGQKCWVKWCSSIITVRFPVSHCYMSWIRAGQFNYLTYFTTTFLQPALVNAMLQYNISHQTLIPM